MNITKDNQWRDGKALERYMLIAPLLEGSLDPAKRLQMREASHPGTGSPCGACTVMKLLSKKRGFPD